MARIKKHLKKKPLIVLCAEGGKKSEEIKYLYNFSSRDLRIQCCTGDDTDVSGMIRNLISYIQREDVLNEDSYKIFILLDTDLNEKRIKEIKEIHKLCNKHNVEIITSAPTFEIWYLLHFRNKKIKFDSSIKVKEELKKVKEKEFLNNELDFQKYLDLKNSEAIKNAKNLVKTVDFNKIIDLNPHTLLFLIMEAINDLKKCNLR